MCCFQVSRDAKLVVDSLLIKDAGQRASVPALLQMKWLQSAFDQLVQSHPSLGVMPHNSKSCQVAACVPAAGGGAAADAGNDAGAGAGAVLVLVLMPLLVLALILAAAAPDHADDAATDLLVYAAESLSADALAAACFWLRASLLLVMLLLLEGSDSCITCCRYMTCCSHDSLHT